MAHNTRSTTKREAANAVVKSVIPFYERASVPTLSLQKMSEEIEKLLLQLKSLMKINVRSRETHYKKTEIFEFKMKLETTMKFWPRNALEVMTNETDKLFLRSMLGDLKASMGARNDITSSTEAKIARRKKAEKRRQEKEKMGKDACLVAEFLDAFNGHEVGGDYYDNDALEANMNSPTLERSHKRVVNTGTPGFWPNDILKSPVILASAVRNKITPTALANLAH